MDVRGGKRMLIATLHGKPSCSPETIPAASFETLSSEYQQRQERRDGIFGSLQGVSRLCDRAVMCLHRGEAVEAKELLKSAQEKLEGALAHVLSEEERYGSISGIMRATAANRSSSCALYNKMPVTASDCIFFREGFFERHLLAHVWTVTF